MQGPPTNILAQMMCLCGRFIRAWQRHPIMLVGEAVQYLFMGAFIGAQPALTPTPEARCMHVRLEERVGPACFVPAPTCSTCLNHCTRLAVCGSE